MGKRALEERGETQADLDEAVLGAIRAFLESEGVHLVPAGPAR